MGLIKYEDLGIKLKPGFNDPPEEIKEKIVLSFLEAAEMNERDFNCPICHRKIYGAYNDGGGHLNIKCKNCGFKGPLNLGYFRRRKLKKYNFSFYPGGGNYKDKR